MDKSIFSGYIPVEKLEVTYSTSSGPGGQNVNKVNTKVDLRFKVESAKWLNDEVRQKLIDNVSWWKIHQLVGTYLVMIPNTLTNCLQNVNKLTKDGYLVIRSEKTRSQQLNLADAMERLRSLIWKAAEPEPKKSEETIEKMRRR